MIDAAHELVRRELPKLIAEKNHYGVGFVGVHDGRGAIFVFIDFWATRMNCIIMSTLRQKIGRRN